MFVTEQRKKDYQRTFLSDSYLCVVVKQKDVEMFQYDCPSKFFGFCKLLMTITVPSFLLLICSSSHANVEPHPWLQEMASVKKDISNGLARGGNPGPGPGIRPGYVAPYGIDRGTCNRDLLREAQIGGLDSIGIEHPAAPPGGGAVAGSIVQAYLAQSMDTIDQGCVGQILEHAKDGKRIEWINESSRIRYQVRPAIPYKNRQGNYCREYQANAVIGVGSRQVHSTACRQLNGSWQLVDK